MKELSIKNQSKVLEILINLCNRQNERTIFMSDYADKVVNECDFVSRDSLCLIIELLRDKQLIEALPSPYLESLNVYSIKITPKGYDFHPQAEYINKRRWSDRIWGFVTGALFSGIVSFIIFIISG